MELFIPHECETCGFSGESKLVFSGPHIKQLCGGCKSYIKFVSKSIVPDIREIRMKIWSITQETKVIETLKVKIGFNSNLQGMELKLMYWKLYLAVREDFGIHCC